jgi:hypothetical protein
MTFLCWISTDTSLAVWAILVAFSTVMSLASFRRNTSRKLGRPEIASWNKLRFLNFLEGVPAL